MAALSLTREVPRGKTPAASGDERLDRFRTGARFRGGKDRAPTGSAPSADGWVERFGGDALVSYKTETAREEILHELSEWALLASLPFRARLWPLSAETKRRARPARAPLRRRRRFARRRRVLERGVCLRIGFRGRLFGRAVSRSAREPAVRQARRAAPAAQLFRLHLFVFGRRGDGRRGNAQHRSLQEIARSRPRQFHAQPARRPTITGSSRTTSWPSCRAWRARAKASTPSFSIRRLSRARKTGRAWQVEHDFEKLLLSALEVAERDARILLSTNCTSSTNARSR